MWKCVIIHGLKMPLGRSSVAPCWIRIDEAGTWNVQIMNKHVNMIVKEMSIDSPIHWQFTLLHSHFRYLNKKCVRSNYGPDVQLSIVCLLKNTNKCWFLSLYLFTKNIVKRVSPPYSMIWTDGQRFDFLELLSELKMKTFNMKSKIYK